MAEKKQSKNTGMAVLAYILFFIPLLTGARNDKFVRYHVKQGLGLFLVAIATIILGSTPIIGSFLSWLASIFVLVLLVIGILNAVQGKEKELPIIGKLVKGFKI